MRSQSSVQQLIAACTLTCLAILSGCGGSKVLKEPEPLTVTKPIATVADRNLTATLVWVIVRDGPGTWAANVDWDEYLMQLENQSEALIRVTSISVTDSLGIQVVPEGTLNQLVARSEEVSDRYKDEGLKINAGTGAESLMVAGGVMTAAGLYVGMSALAGSATALGATSAAAGAVVLGPAILLAGAAGALVKSNNNYAVDEHIRATQTLLPIVLPAGHKKDLFIFLPLTPSPKQVNVTYADARGQHTLTIDTRASLEGLHLGSPVK